MGDRAVRSGPAGDRVGRGAGGKAALERRNLLDGPRSRASSRRDPRAARPDRRARPRGGHRDQPEAADKEPSEFDLVFDVKADGFFSLLKAAEEMPIGATVVFSSVAGRFGNDGQTDYSAANDLLCTISRALRRSRPGDARDRHRLDRLGRHRHGHARLDPADHGGGRHRHAPAGVRDPDRPPRARRGGILGRGGRGREARNARRRSTTRRAASTSEKVKALLAARRPAVRDDRAG